MSLRKKLDDAAGRACEAILPIKEEYYLGRGKKLAICTLSSMDLLEQISKSDLMDKIAIAGRLLSENRGIDAMIKFVTGNPDLRVIIVCGKEVKGHRPGQALLALVKNGVDRNERIIGASGPYPILRSTAQDIAAFIRQIGIIDMIGTKDLKKLVA